MMKKILLALVIAASAICSIHAQKVKNPKVEDVYDLYKPKNTGGVSIWVHGEGHGIKGRISLFFGRNPLTTDKEGKFVEDKANAMLQPDPAPVVTKFVGLRNHGSEDGRAFHLYGHVGFGREVWTKVIFSFVPRLTGKVRISVSHGGGRFRDPVTKKEFQFPNWGYCRYAKFEVIQGTKLTDPNLQNKTKWGIGRNPYPGVFPKQIKCEMISDKDGPTVKVLRSTTGLSQIIPVKKDQPVMISFYVKGDDWFDAKF